MRVLLLNGPNLDLLGTREPEIYGTTTLADLEDQITEWSAPLGIEPSFRQSNHEGELVDAIHDAKDMDGIVINAAALTHTSRSIGDAIGSVGVPAVEVHISNIVEREPWRRVSFVSDACVMTIYGRGIPGYRDALRHLANLAACPVEGIRYGPHPENVADLRMPDTSPDGLVVLVHGGFWLGQYLRDSMESLAVDLGHRGLASLNVEYRRLGTGGGWPGSAHDVETALRRVRTIDEVADLPIAVIGHSAGGHLALWAASRRGAERLDLVVGLAAVTDLEALSRTSGDGASPARRLLSDGAPTRLQAPKNTFLAHGSDDRVVEATHGTRLAPEARVELFDGLGHFEMLDPARAHWPTVVTALGEALA